MPVKSLSAKKSVKAGKGKSDREIVEGCLKGHEEDWNILIDKYKNLIFSIPVRYGFTREESADIFQSVCLELLHELAKVREPQALPKWLMQVTAHKCFHAKRQRNRMVSRDDDDVEVPESSVPAQAEINLREMEEEQILRNAISELQPRCRELIHMLFYEEPRRPYQQVASSLGLATGSIGFLRQNCLDRLKVHLGTLGFS
jgi:RNA polymerase sigma factor (sigma-70 family)